MCSGHDSTVHGLFIIVLAVYAKVSVSDTDTSIKRNCSEVQSVDFANKLMVNKPFKRIPLKTIVATKVSTWSVAEGWKGVLGEATGKSEVDTARLASGSNNREPYQLEEVKAIQSTDHAFSAIKFDGTVISWGDLDACSGNQQVRHQLRDVHEIQATAHAFAAIKTDGSVVTWPVEGEGASGLAAFIGSPYKTVLRVCLCTELSTCSNQGYGGDSDAVQKQLTRVRAIQASRRAFAALTADGNVVTWGAAEAGGDSRSVQAELRNVKCIQASHNAFAALREDGRIIYWPAGNLPVDNDMGSHAMFGFFCFQTV